MSTQEKELNEEIVNEEVKETVENIYKALLDTEEEICE